MIAERYYRTREDWERCLVQQAAAKKMLEALRRADGRLALDVETIFAIRDALSAACAAGISEE